MIASEKDRAALDNYRDLSVGEILRRARIQAGYELEPIAHHLNIRPTLLEALEKGDYDRLPGRVYVVGFVRTYAEALGLDGEKIVYLLKSQALGHDDRPLPSMRLPDREHRMPGPVALAISMGALVLVIVLWAIFSGHGDEKPDIPEPPASELQQPAEG